jgi:hypothetical protein
MTELGFPVPPLADDVVLLRPWAEADMPAIVLAFSDPVMQRFSWRTAPYTEADARGYLAGQAVARARGEALSFALAVIAPPRSALGRILFFRNEWALRYRHPGVVVGVSFALGTWNLSLAIDARSSREGTTDRMSR